jgi:hypothetical protein
MTKVLEFYHKSFGKSLSTSEVSKAFEIEVYKELQLDDTNKYLLVFPLKAKHLLQHQLT